MNKMRFLFGWDLPIIFSDSKVESKSTETGIRSSVLLMGILIAKFINQIILFYGKTTFIFAKVAKVWKSKKNNIGNTE